MKKLDTKSTELILGGGSGLAHGQEAVVLCSRNRSPGVFFSFFSVPGVAEFAASFKSPITSSPPKWMAELENDDIDMLKELGSLTTANLMEKVRGLQNLAYQLGLDESREMTRGKFLNILEKPKK
nr:PREDICTED: protein lin-52 homolog [Struthio camelus australis]